MNKRYLFALLLIPFVLFSACSKKDDAEVWKAKDYSSLSQEEHEARVRQRHQERWDAVIRVDFDRVYEYTTPEYRTIYSKTHLHNQYGAQIMRKSVRIISLKFDADDPTLVHIETGLTFATVTASGGLYEDEILLRDKWRFSQGDWWYVEPR